MIFPFLQGMPGEPLPYLFRSDWVITCILCLCTLVLVLVVSKGKKHLYQQLNHFFLNRERNSMFDEVATMDVRYRGGLVVHACLMLGFCVYCYLAHEEPFLFHQYDCGLLLGFLTVCFMGYVLLKWMVYGFVNWVFFQKDRNKRWIAAFFNLFIWLGILLLPVVLLMVYFDISTQIILYIAGILVVFAKIALFWKCFCNFFEKFYGALHLILYFCALEIIPDLILWKGIEMMNNNLILNL